MTTKTRNWILGVAGAIAAPIIVISLIAQFGHYAQAGQNTRSIEQNEEIVDELKKIVKGLSGIHTAEEAEKVAIAKLCNSGKLKDCDECADAEVTLPKCVE